MLVLTRKLGQRITLVDSRTGDDVAVLTVARVGEGAVRIGFEAPDHIVIARNEVLRHGNDNRNAPVEA